MFKLFLSLSLLSITTCTIYDVTPDDTTCHHCHNLQHYLLNTTKYFNSNTQLLFLPGLHRLHTNLIIQNVHNISLIGSTTNGTTPDTAIQCDPSVGIVMNNITSLTMRNMVIQNCTAGYDIPTETYIAILIEQCSLVQLHSIQTSHTGTSSIKVINTIGDSYLANITCDSISLHYNKTIKELHDQTVLTIDNFHTNNNSKRIAILLTKFKEYSKNITLKLTNTCVNASRSMILLYLYIHIMTVHCDKVFITDCQFYGNTLEDEHSLPFTIDVSPSTSVYFSNCKFQYPLNSAGIIKMENGFYMEIDHCNFSEKGIQVRSALINAENCLQVAIKNSNFHYNAVRLLKVQQPHNYRNAQVIIQNTTFSGNIIANRQSLISITNSTLILKGPITFNRNIGVIFVQGKIDVYITIFELYNSRISANGYIEFSENHIGSIVYHVCKKELDCFFFSILGSTIINITSNVLSTYFTAKFPNPPSETINYPVCYFQYFNVRDNGYCNVEENTTIILHNNKYKGLTIESELKDALIPDRKTLIPTESELHITHCYWLPQSLFNGIIPIDVNKEYMRLTNNSKQLSRPNQRVKKLCYCTSECYTEDLGYLYPGQTLTIPLYFHHNFVFAIEVIAKVITNNTHLTSCVVHDAKQNKQFITRNCTKLNYTIAFPTENWCELFLTVPQNKQLYYNIFYIRQLPCPLGFKKIKRICQCYPSLKTFGITNCDINAQTILRSANTWLSAVTTNDSYHISKHCPFHYCLPYPSHLNLSTPDSQCQFNRSGLLCGQCQHGLSTVFGSSYCKQCSSLYLTLIIPIGIAGLLLVLLLFLLNLTVTDGSINAFIFYVNIISINSTVFFPHQHNVSPAYIFISLANLDLGIQTCFYNGMDDYAKMWLQLTFPFYLIFLATLLIITSRYSTTIQRLTANRALPVLATLFLLSYTKILRTVSSVLFFYSSITHLPSQHTTQVWSVDANIPLFGVKFTIIFIVCLLLFLILLPFNIILLFTRTLSRFNVINKFKPLLDAYQGPYKIKFYYWTGLQLVIRVVFFGMSSLDVNINLTACIIILSIIEGVQVICKPFKNKFNNFQELLLTINLLLLYTFTLSSQGDVNITGVYIMNAMAAVHFSLIIMYHIITYVCGGVMRKKLSSGVNVCKERILKLKVFKKLLKQESKTDNNKHKSDINIPDKTYNYWEYREPVIGSEYN